MIQQYNCHPLNLGDRVSLQQMSSHLNLKSSIGTQNFEFSGPKNAFTKLKKSRGWKQFVHNAKVTRIE